MLATTGYNLRHWIRKIISVLENIIITITALLENYISGNGFQLSQTNLPFEFKVEYLAGSTLNR